MKNLIAKMLGAAVATVALTAMPGAASAEGTGYVCKAGYYPGSFPIWGDYGYAWAYYYSGPYCTGSFLQGVYYYGTGSTLSTIQYTDLELQALVSNLARAARTPQRVYFSDMQYVEFTAN
jgi:hypothetical protein